MPIGELEFVTVFLALKRDCSAISNSSDRIYSCWSCGRLKVGCVACDGLLGRFRNDLGQRRAMLEYDIPEVRRNGTLKVLKFR